MITTANVNYQEKTSVHYEQVTILPDNVTIPDEMWEGVGISSPAIGLLFDTNTGNVCSPLAATNIGDAAIPVCPN